MPICYKKLDRQLTAAIRFAERVFCLCGFKLRTILCLRNLHEMRDNLVWRGEQNRQCKDDTEN